MDSPPEPPSRFPPRRLVLLLGVVGGALYIFGAIRPLLDGRQGDITQAIFGAAILLPCAYMFWRYHAED